MVAAPAPDPPPRIDFVDPECTSDLPGTPLHQSATYAAVLASFGCTCALAELRAQGALIGRARIFSRRAGPLRLAWLPRGPVWSAASSAQQRVHAIAALPRAAPWRALWAISDDGQYPGCGIPVSRALQMAELDLAPSKASRRAALHGKWRNRLKRAEASGLGITARPLDVARDAPLLALEAAQRRTRGYSGLPGAFTARRAKIAPDDTLMMIASEAGTPAAFMLMVMHGDGASYLTGWSGARGRALNAHTLLLWRAACTLAELGHTRLDLGRIDPARAPGLARFKLGTGAEIRHVGATRLRF